MNSDQRPALRRFHFRRLIAAGLLAVCGPVSAAATQAGAPQAASRSPLDGPAPVMSGDAAWFGLRLPGPETGPAEGAYDTARTDLPARPGGIGWQRIDPALRGAAIYRDVRTIVGFSYESRAAGDYLWGRVTGRPAYDRTVAWVAAQLRTAGLVDARLESFRARLALPVSGEVRLIGGDAMGAGSRDLVLRSAMVQGVGPVTATVTAPLVYVGQGLDADLAGRDLAGRIAVIVSSPEPSLYASVPARRTEAMIRAGAVGVIEIEAQPGNLKSFDRDRHGCGQRLCFTIGGRDGYFLQNVLGAAARRGRPVVATLSATSETIDRPIANVVATIPGRSNRTIIIDAHADGWFGGADDNATGLAILVALARDLKKRPMPERTLVFVASAGHHSSGASGLEAFRARHDRDLVARADLILNIEHPAQIATMRSYVIDQDDNFGLATIAASGDLSKQVAVNNRAPFLIDLWRKGVACFGLDTQRVVDTRLPGELKAFADRPDIPQTQMIASGAVYHTSGDDLYSISPEGLERAALFYAYLIERSANAPARLLRGAPWSPTPRCPVAP